MRLRKPSESSCCVTSRIASSSDVSSNSLKLLVGDRINKQIMRYELGYQYDAATITDNGYFVGFNAPIDPKIRNLECENTGYMDGHWSFSAAGHVERDESVTAAAVREAFEELGVRVREEDLEPLCTIHRRQNERDGGQRVDFFFTTSRWEGEPMVKETDRSGGVVWAPLSALPEPLVPVDAIALEMLASGDRRAIVHWGFDDR